jgi:hypothetical protein
MAIVDKERLGSPGPGMYNANYSYSKTSKAAAFGTSSR